MTAPVRVNLRRAFVRVAEAVEDWTIAARADLLPAKFVPVYRFSHEFDVDRFQITTDAVLGGSTRASFSLKKYDAFQAGVFEGIVDYHDDNPNTRGGFAALRTKADDKIRDLHTCAALELRVKTDGRPYILNVKSSDMNPDQLWQMRLQAPAWRWTTLACPFHELVLTRRGNTEVTQVPLKTNTISGIGILLADGKNGPFRFEVQYVRGVTDFDIKDYAVATQARAILQLSERSRALAAADAEATASRNAMREQHRQQREKSKLV